MILPEHVEGMRLRSPGRAGDGGEWDAVRALPVRTVRRLRGAGYLGRAGGYAPDQLAHDLRHHVHPDTQVCDVIELWHRAVLLLLAEQRRENRRRRENRLATAAGCRSWYEYRRRLYEARGAASVHQYATQVGWR